MINNIRSFLYDKEYFVNIYEDKVYVFNYIDLMTFSSEVIVLGLEKFKIVIEGQELIINKMEEKEILISGIIKGVSFK